MSNKICIGLIAFPLVLVLGVMIVGCGKVQDQPGINSGPSGITSLSITPAEVNIEIGASIQFTVEARDGNGNIIGATPTWSVVGDIGGISADGLFTADNITSGKIQATYNGLSANAPVTVTEIGGIGYLAISNQWISPNGDGINDSTVIEYSLNQKKNIALKLYGMTGEVLGSIYEGEVEGFNRLTWDSKLLGSSQIISDGNYSIKIVVDGIETTKYVNVIIDTTKPVVELLSNPSAISPNNDGVQDLTTFTYRITDDLSPTVSARLLQYTGNNQLSNILWDDSAWASWGKLGEQFTTSWNGRIGVGGYLLDRRYMCKIEAADLAGNTGYATCEVIVDTQPPRLENAAVDNVYFSPNNDGLKDTASINFFLSDNIFNEIKVNAIIKDALSQEVITLKNRETFIGGGERSIIWDGKDNNGNIVDVGEYTFNLFAEDGAANICNTIVLPINVDI